MQFVLNIIKSSQQLHRQMENREVMHVGLLLQAQSRLKYTDELIAHQGNSRAWAMAVHRETEGSRTSLPISIVPCHKNGDNCKQTLRKRGACQSLHKRTCSVAKTGRRCAPSVVATLPEPPGDSRQTTPSSSSEAKVNRGHGH